MPSDFIARNQAKHRIPPQKQENLTMLLRIVFSLALSLMSVTPTLGATLSDYLRPASSMQEKADLVLSNKSVLKAVTLHKFRVGKTTKPARLKSTRLVHRMDMKRVSLNRIEGYRLYENSYRSGGRSYKGYMFLELSYKLVDDAAGKGRWAPSLSFYSVAFKGAKYAPRNVVAARCGNAS